MSAWQDIGTAPKDGSEILVADSYGVHKVAWLDNASRPSRGKSRKLDFAWCVPGSWQDEQGGFYTIDNPTHWMPLPEPPETEAA